MQVIAGSKWIIAHRLCSNKWRSGDSVIQHENPLQAGHPRQLTTHNFTVSLMCHPLEINYLTVAVFSSSCKMHSRYVSARATACIAGRF
jgi:hypothetical protein